jgi:hypothetical protein
MLGTGIYALTGDVAGQVGGAAWLAFGGAFVVVAGYFQQIYELPLLLLVPVFVLGLASINHSRLS